MAAYDSIINVEEWISDYYLTTDDKGASFAKRVSKAIDAWKEEGEANPYTRFTSKRSELQTVLAKLPQQATHGQLHAAYDLIDEAFGYPSVCVHEVHRGESALLFEGGIDHQNSITILRAEQLESLEDLPTLRLLDAKSSQEIDTAPEQDNLTLPLIDGKTADYRAQKLTTEIFLSESGPDFIVILAGNWAIVAEKETWPLGRYLAVDLALAIERNETKATGEIQRIVSILAF